MHIGNEFPTDIDYARYLHALGIWDTDRYFVERGRQGFVFKIS